MLLFALEVEAPRVQRRYYNVVLVLYANSCKRRLGFPLRNESEPQKKKKE